MSDVIATYIRRHLAANAADTYDGIGRLTAADYSESGRPAGSLASGSIGQYRIRMMQIEE